MAAGKSQIGFTLPERHKPGRDAFDTRPRKVAAWIAQLPLGNVGETARQVYGALHQSNRMRIPWDRRYHLLEALRGPAAFVNQALHKRFTGVPLPLPAKTQRIASLATELHNEMALGYKIAIEDMLSRNFLFRDRRALTIMLHRALRYLNQVLLISYQLYAAPPKDTWADLHRLYHYAERRHLLKSSVTDKELGILPKTSIATAYKQALLLALATPYRLRQGEVNTVFGAVESWAQLAQIKPYDARADHEAPLFVTHLTGNSEPTHLAFNRFPCADGHCRLIDLEHLAVDVHDELAQAEAGASTALKQRRGTGMTLDLLRRLSMTWGAPPKRGTVRSNTNAAAEVVVGLSAVHRALSPEDTHHDSTLEQPFSQTATFSSRAVRTTATKKADVWNVFTASGTTGQPRETQGTTAKTIPLVIQHWELRDRSSSGCRIVRTGSDTLGVQVGELIGVRPLGSEDGLWGIGVVRWIRHGSREELELGVQIIATRAQPVAARTKQTGNPPKVYQRIIRLAELEEPPQPPSLLAPPLLFGVGTTVLVREGQAEQPLLLTGLLESTGSFAQYTFEVLDVTTGGIRAEKTDPRPASSADYATVWKDL